MKKQTLNQSGIAHLVLIIILVVVVGVIGYSAFRVYESKQDSVTTENAAEKAAGNPVKIKSMPIDIGYFNPATGKAGDIVFPQDKFPEGAMQLVFTEYGYQVPGNSANGGQPKLNPQPTFIAPLGTKVRSIVDGTVVSIPQLYSNDFSIHVQGQGSDLIFETEHVINVKVKVGDKVTAGQVIAEVSDYDAKNYNGLGLVEIGVLKGGNPPSHVCTFDYLDDSIKEETLKRITALKKAWEEFRGDPNAYDESAVVVPGCVTRDPIEG